MPRKWTPMQKLERRLAIVTRQFRQSHDPPRQKDEMEEVTARRVKHLKRMLKEGNFEHQLGRYLTAVVIRRPSSNEDQYVDMFAKDFAKDFVEKNHELIAECAITEE